jgi:hypothetical protein
MGTLRAFVVAFLASAAANAAAIFVAAALFAPGRAPDGPAASPRAPDVAPPPLAPSQEVVRQADGQHYFHFRYGQLVGAWRWRTREYFPRSPYSPGGWGAPTRAPADFVPPSGDVGDLTPPK